MRNGMHVARLNDTGALLACLLLAGASIQAQGSGLAVPSVPASSAPVLSTVPTVPQGATPQPAQMSGLPIQVADLPPGTVVVRVIRNSFAENVRNWPVDLSVGSPARRERSTTDANGRASFSGLAVGELVSVRSVVSGQTLQSQAFTLPARGGVRLVLVAEGSATLAGPQSVVGVSAAVPPQASGPSSQRAQSHEWIAPLVLLTATVLAFLWAVRGRFGGRRRSEPSPLEPYR